MPKDFDGISEYEKGFAIDDLFEVNSLGIQTHRDQFIIDISQKELEKRIVDVFDESNSKENVLAKYHLKETSDFKIQNARQSKFDNSKFVKIDYRPFDIRSIYYDKNFIDRDRNKVMKHLMKENFSLIVSKHLSTFDFQHVFISKHISESCLISIQTKEQGYCFPLYLYIDTNGQRTISQNIERIPNLNAEITKKFSNKINLTFTIEKDSNEDTFSPIDILDYIYAVLHSAAYRTKYKEFLKIDFPRVPYPKDKNTFWHLVKFGRQIREVHLFDSPTVNNFITQYSIDGNNVVDKILYEDGKIYINNDQYFDNVPRVVWEFFIGGYQPAQKWLKDRKGKPLEFDDILHYQKIIMALTETHRLMNEIDKISIE